MIHRNKPLVFLLFSLTLMAGILCMTSCKKDNKQNPPLSAAIEIEFMNSGAASWMIIRSTDASVATINTPNPVLTLKTGSRYKIINNGGAMHPFELRNGANMPLLAQRATITGLFQDNAEVNFLRESTGISFTLSAELAAQLSKYHCSNHSAMNGNVVIAP